jgi:hypothetical protein
MATYAGPVATVGPIVLSKDYINGVFETGTISGTVKTQTAPLTLVPTYCNVVLFRDHDHQPIQELWTDAVTGAYSFSGMDKHLSYTVIAFHPTLAYRAVLADGVFPT